MAASSLILTKKKFSREPGPSPSIFFKIYQACKFRRVLTIGGEGEGWLSGYVA